MQTNMFIDCVTQSYCTLCIFTQSDNITDSVTLSIVLLQLLFQIDISVTVRQVFSHYVSVASPAIELILFHCESFLIMEFSIKSVCDVIIIMIISPFAFFFIEMMQHTTIINTITNNASSMDTEAEITTISTFRRLILLHISYYHINYYLLNQCIQASNYRQSMFLQEIRLVGSCMYNKTCMAQKYLLMWRFCNQNDPPL